MITQSLPVTPYVDNIINGFVDLKGFPYLLADYLDKRNFKQIDRSMINAYVKTDQTEPMRAIVEVSIDDIQKNADGSLSTLGNTTKQINLLQMIERNFQKLQNRLPVIKKGIIVRITYRLENNTTGEVIRSSTEDFRIPQAQYYVDINPKNISDNAIINHFMGSSISTMNYFTSGRDPMLLRIMNVDYFYEIVVAGINGNDDIQNLDMFGNDLDIHEYHRLMNDKYHVPSYGIATTETIIPPQWIMFNRFYHFDNSGKDIILHKDEINSPNTKTSLLPIGSVVINKTIMINPAHRIIFKFNIWRNDFTMFNDTTSIAETLRASVAPNPYAEQESRYYYPPRIYPDGRGGEYFIPQPQQPPVVVPRYSNEELLALLNKNKMDDFKQNEVINKMSDTITMMMKMIKELKGDNSETKEIPKLPEQPKYYDRDEAIAKLLEVIDELVKQGDENKKLIETLKKEKEDFAKKNDELDKKVKELEAKVAELEKNKAPQDPHHSGEEGSHIG